MHEILVFDTERSVLSQDFPGWLRGVEGPENLGRKGFSFLFTIEGMEDKAEEKAVRCGRQFHSFTRMNHLSC